MRTADLVAETLVSLGVQDVFMVTGGGAMHLNDAFGRHPGLRVTCFHHEQAAAMAAESFFRFTNRLVAVNVTSGPGGVNALNGVAGGYLDSLGMIVLAGQMKRATLVRTSGLPLRQFGDQEIDVVRMAAPVTKWAVAVDDPEMVLSTVQRAVHLARSGRPGPTWVEIPVDVQAASVDPAACPRYDPHDDDVAARGSSDVPAAARTITQLVRDAQRPVVYAGAGIRLADAVEPFQQLIEQWGVPVVTSLNGHDLLDADHPLLVGRPGTIGDRGGNYAVQNADLVVVLGTRLPIRQVGYDWKTWAPHATVVMVDIDAAELAKPSLHVEVPVHADVAEVIAALLAQPNGETDADHGDWLAWCRERAARYPVVLSGYREQMSPINPYAALDEVFTSLPAGAAVVAGVGWAGVGTAQVARPRNGQRVYSNSGCGSMGHELPAALGAAIADPSRPVYCIAGDGGLQLNLQELQTLVHHGLPVRLVVLENGGYHSIRQTQARFFPDGSVGFDDGTGIGFPDLVAIAEAYGIPARRVTALADLPGALDELRVAEGPALLAVEVDRNQDFAPKAASRALPDGRMESAPLDDLAPFLPREEYRLNQHPGGSAGAKAVPRQPQPEAAEFVAVTSGAGARG